MLLLPVLLFLPPMRVSVRGSIKALAAGAVVAVAVAMTVTGCVAVAVAVAVAAAVAVVLAVAVAVAVSVPVTVWLWRWLCEGGCGCGYGCESAHPRPTLVIFNTLSHDVAAAGGFCMESGGCRSYAGDMAGSWW